MQNENEKTFFNLKDIIVKIMKETVNLFSRESPSIELHVQLTLVSFTYV